MGNVDHGGHLFLAVDVQEVNDRNPLGGPTVLWNFVALHGKDLPGVGEEEQEVVSGTSDQVLDEVVTVDAHPLHPAAPTVLGLKFVNRQALDVTIVGEGDDDVFFFDV